MHQLRGAVAHGEGGGSPLRFQDRVRGYQCRGQLNPGSGPQVPGDGAPTLPSAVRRPGREHTGVPCAGDVVRGDHRRPRHRGVYRFRRFAGLRGRPPESHRGLRGWEMVRCARSVDAQFSKSLCVELLAFVSPCPAKHNMTAVLRLIVGSRAAFRANFPKIFPPRQRESRSASLTASARASSGS